MHKPGMNLTRVALAIACSVLAAMVVLVTAVGVHALRHAEWDFALCFLTIDLLLLAELGIDVWFLRGT